MFDTALNTMAFIWLATTALLTAFAAAGYFQTKARLVLAASGLAILSIVNIAIVNTQSADKDNVYEAVSLVNPSVLPSQVRKSAAHPQLFEIYHEGRIGYVLGENTVIKGEIFDMKTGRNLTQQSLEMFQALNGSAFGRDSTPTRAPQANTAPQVAAQPAAPIQKLPELKTADPEPLAVDQQTLESSLAILANEVIPDEMTVVYPAIGEKKHQLTIFSDITCPVCAKNHTDYREFQEAGVTIRAALFPRKGPEAPEAIIMQKVLCADSMEGRRLLLDRAYAGDPLDDAPMCDNDYVESIRTLAVATDTGLGVTATPTIMSAKGVRIDGYPRVNAVATVLELLNEQ